MDDTLPMQRVTFLSNLICNEFEVKGFYFSF